MSFLSVGDIAPPFSLPTDSGDAFDLYGDDVAGNFIAIVFCPCGISGAAEQLQGFAEHFGALQQAGVMVVAVSDESQSVLAKCREDLALPFELISDHGRRLFGGYGIATDESSLDSQPVTLLVRPNLHCLSVMRDGAHAQATLEIVGKQRGKHIETELAFQPPILMVPDVLTRDDCRRLIDIYDAPEVPIVKVNEVDERDLKGDVKAKVPDYKRQDRMDHFIATEESKTFFSNRLRNRLLPEIKKAFHYEVKGYEGLRIGCYEGERGGEAHGHRDNSLPEVAHRRFALSINLNTEEFEGGGIRFPEFGPQCYRPQNGAALVFSCSLLHEALAVSRGRRLVLLAFLHAGK